jgi:hypothetical protein
MNKPNIGDVYYHFKDVNKPEGERKLYSIVGIARHSETEEVLVIYKAHYDMDYLNEVSADFMARPLEMFMDSVDRDGYSGSRFIKN